MHNLSPRSRRCHRLKTAALWRCRTRTNRLRRRHRPRVDQPPRPPPGRRGRHPARVLTAGDDLGRLGAAQPEQLHVGGAGLEPEVDEARALGHAAGRDVGRTGAHDQVGAGRDLRRQRDAGVEQPAGEAAALHVGGEPVVHVQHVLARHHVVPDAPHPGGDPVAVGRQRRRLARGPPGPRHQHRPEAEAVGLPVLEHRDEELGRRGQVGVGEVGVVHVRARVAVHRQHAGGVLRHRAAQQHAVAGVDPLGRRRRPGRSVLPQLSSAPRPQLTE